MIPDPTTGPHTPSPCHPNPRLIPVRDFAPQSAPLKAAIKPEPVADAESCGAKSSVLLKRSSFKAIPYYSRSVQGWCSCSTRDALLACFAAHTRILTCVYAPRAQKETEEQKTSKAKTEEQGTKAEKPKPQVRLALPSSPHL